MPGTPGSATFQPRDERPGQVKTRNGAGRVDHRGDHEEGGDAEHQAEDGQQAGPDPHGPTDLAGPLGLLGARQTQESDADGLGEREGGQSTGEREDAHTDRHGHGDGHVA